MPSNPYHQGANAFAHTKTVFTNQTLRITHAAGHSVIKECQLSEVGLDITNAVDQISLLTLEHTDILNSTILSAGEVCVNKSSIQRSRMSAAESLRFSYSYIRKTYLRIQPGTGLDMVNNDVDELYIEGSDGFSHEFNMEGLFTRCRFKGLKVFDGSIISIFYKNQWKDVLIRDSIVFNTIFNQCAINEVVFKGCVFNNVTFSMCDFSEEGIVFEGCNFMGLRLIGVEKQDFIFINCKGLSTVSSCD
ncbi:pentapeptide repeat-containing protein [Candidatus Pantoea formicae]|uniref:pentapeptide repeat-containing protein n=1 Tax=Candidatus Pantoea formicae TaxID=2608355 RepID=UPI003EDA1BBE